MEPFEIYYRTSSSAHAQPITVDQPQLECRDWVTISGKYLDRWNTPMAGAEFKLWINEGLVLEREFLKDYKHLNLTEGQSPKTAAEQKAWEELGTFTYRNCNRGNARAEIVRDPAMEAEIEDIRNALHARLDGAYQNLKEHIKPYQKQWDEWGWLSLEISRAEGFAEGAKEWAEGLKELFTAEYWCDIGGSIKSGFLWTLDTYVATVRSTDKLIQDAYDNREVILDPAWWQKRADDVVEGAREARQTAERLITEGAEALERSAEAALAIYKHRAAIPALPDKVVSGDVDGIEEFIETALAEIAPGAAERLRYSRDWQGTIELLHDGEAAATFAVYLDLFITVVPPNFWAHQFGKVGFYVLVEVVLILIGLLLGGAGGAARVGMLSARLARMGAKAAKVGKVIDKAMDAFRALQKMIDTFFEAATDIEKLKDKLLKARRRNVRRGATRSTLNERRETEKREGKCKVCGSKRHHTPLHRHGQVDYV